MPAVPLSWTPSTDPNWSDTLIYCGTTHGGPYTYNGAPTYDTSPKSVGLVSFASFTVPDTGAYWFVVRFVLGSVESDASEEVVYPIGSTPTPGSGLAVSVR